MQVYEELKLIDSDDEEDCGELLAHSSEGALQSATLC